LKNIKSVVFIPVLLITLSIYCFAEGFTKTAQYPATFKDVSADAWYAQDIKNVYELGLMDGVSDDKFDIDSQMTVSQAVTIAARLHSLYHGKDIPCLENSKAWYDRYVSYCINNGIITEKQFKDYNAPIMSYETVTLFACALPNEHYGKINNVTAISDVPKEAPFFDEVLLFYNAGILCGNDDYGTFLPTQKLTRARAAAIISRIALPQSRKSFTLLDVPSHYDIDTVIKLLSYQAEHGTLDGIVLMNVDGIDISGAQYRYYSYANNGSKSKIENAIIENTVLIKLAKEHGLKITRSQLSSILMSYYNSKTANYGNSTYFSVLESNRLSDAVFANLVVTNELTPLLISHFHSQMTPPVVAQYAKENGYICARHILISKDSPNAYRTIKDIEAQLNSGADFTNLLDKYGEDPGMKERKYGYCFNKGKMVKPFEDAAFALNIGQTSGVVNTDYGYHIIQRLEIDPSALEGNPDFEDISAYAAVEFFNEKADALIKTFAVSYVKNFDNLAAVID